MQALSNYQWQFSQNQDKKFYNLYGNTKDPKLQKQSWERKTELEESGSLSKTTLQSYSHQNSMVLTQKQKQRLMGQHRKSREKPSTYGHLLLLLRRFSRVRLCATP